MKKINNEENLTLASTEVEAVEVKQEKTIEQIAEDIKKEHGLKEVFITDIADQKVIWRKLKRSEYKEVMTREYDENEDLAYFEKQDFVASKVILYPENVEELLEDFAGIADIIATETTARQAMGRAPERCRAATNGQ